MFSTLPKVNRQSPSRFIPAQSSLESVISFTLYSPSSPPDELAEACLLYHEIVRGCEEASIFISPPGVIEDREDYKDHDDYKDYEGHEGGEEGFPLDDRVYLHKLFGCLLSLCPNPDGRSNIIRMVLIALFAPHPDPTDHVARSLTTILPLARRYLTYTPIQRNALFTTMRHLAHELLTSFFIPLKAQGRNTPSISSLITPTSRSEPSPHQGVRNRLRSLRALILARDNHACVVSGLPDKHTTERRQRHRRAALPKVTRTEAAHIIPHSLNSLENHRSTLSPSKHTVWRVLNMFDPGVAHTLEGELIDSPVNALLLAQDLHDRFGGLEAYFEQVDGGGCYRFVFVDGYGDVLEELRPRAPIVFANHEPLGHPRSPLPSARLLRLHRACCLILSMSGAAGYVEKLLGDVEEVWERGELPADGAIDVGMLLRARGLCGDDDDNWRKERGSELVMC